MDTHKNILIKSSIEILIIKRKKYNQHSVSEGLPQTETFNFNVVCFLFNHSIFFFYFLNLLPVRLSRGRLEKLFFFPGCHPEESLNETENQSQ